MEMSKALSNSLEIIKLLVGSLDLEPKRPCEGQLDVD